jgi:pectate lyase
MDNIAIIKFLYAMNRFIFFFLFAAVACGAGGQTPVDFCMTNPVGYGGNVTGGAGGNVVTVASHAELKAALKASGKSIIIVTQDITFGEGMVISEVIQNKTLLGLNGVKLVSTAQVKNSGILGLKANSSNVIIRNLIFEGPGAYDVDGQDLISNTGCIGLWVDHCEFYDGVDGNFDNTNSADNVSISWCKFGYNKPPKAGGSGGSNDHRFTNLIGGSASAAPADGHYSITFQCCYWSDGCKERMPRARNAEIHILNCYYNTNISSSTALGLEGGVNGLDCYVEGSYFKQIGTIYKNYNGTGSKPHTLAFVDCKASKAIPANIGTTPVPTYSYTSLPVADVEAAVTSSRGAGATLAVNTTGEASSPSTGVDSPASSRPTVFYDSAESKLRVLSETPVQRSMLYSLQGSPLQKIHTAGVYIARVVLENQESFTSKIIVK